MREVGTTLGVAMNYQTLELGVWLGMAVLAVIWASLNLWRARRLLNRLHEGVHVRERRFVSSAVTDKTRSVGEP
jgi:hypothetical protein